MTDELENDIARWMVEYGPDGHCDGADIIARKIRKKYIDRLKAELKKKDAFIADHQSEWRLWCVCKKDTQDKPSDKCPWPSGWAEEGIDGDWPDNARPSERTGKKPKEA